MRKGARYCPSCGASPNGAGDPLELVLGDGTRVPLVEEVTIGRGAASTLRLSDPAVSRAHARITPGSAPVIEDAGSSYGTWLDGRRLDRPRPLDAGARIRLGNQELAVDRARRDSEAGRTIVVPTGSSLVVPTGEGHAELARATSLSGTRPRLRSGYALKRLEAGEGVRRWLLKDLSGNSFMRLGDADAELLRLLDGSRGAAELVGEAEARQGEEGPARLALLLAQLGERGLLAESPSRRAEEQPKVPRLLAPRQRAWPGAWKLFDRLYERGGWLLFTRTAWVALAALGLAGLVAFVALLVGRYGTPFIVANRLGLGGLVFIVGRLAIAAAHETAHALAMASFGRRVGAAGVKLVLIFPYAFVDTSDAWFEPRRRRIAVSAAGPVSDFTLGAIFSLACLALAGGTVRDIFFQLAFAAYLGALFNLNPLLERDGYQILVDVLGEPGLRRRAVEQLGRVVAGQGRLSDSPTLTRYALLAVGWLGVTAAFGALLSVRYQQTLAALTSPRVAWALLIFVWLALLTPLLAMLVPPLRQRRSASASAG